MVISSTQPPSNPQQNFEDFFRTFEEKPGEFKYRKKISDVYAESRTSIEVLFEDILGFDPTLANYLRISPNQALSEAKEALLNIIRVEAGGSFNPAEEYFVRIISNNNSNEVLLREIRATHIDKLIYVSGIIIRASDVRPQIISATYQCPMCGNLTEEPQTGSKLSSPDECENPACNNKKDFKIITELSNFIDYQLIYVQEVPEELKPGAIPKTVKVILRNELVNTVNPGERVKIMGIYTSFVNINARGRDSTIFQTEITTNSIKGGEEDEDSDITEEERQEIIALSQEDGIQEKIARSIATSIMGHDHLKMAAAFSLFGGNQKIKKDGTKLRGDIHVLFIGDPGTGKSQILQNCAKIATRSIYTSGKGSSAAGLTAAVVQDKNGGGLQLEAGALVLASGGIAAIDEFDKMREEDRSAIHEAMEQQSYHPNFEITFSDKRSIRIGSFVDDLFKKYPDNFIEGKDCEILRTVDLGHKVQSTDFKQIQELPVHRVSRHTAPKSFYKIIFSNGREIIVTPEHPLFTMNSEGKIDTVNACEAESDMFIPGVRSIEFKNSQS